MKEYKQDEEMEPILTVPDFDSLRELDLEKNAKENKIRTLSLISLSGFQEGEIFVTIRLFKLIIYNTNFFYSRKIDKSRK